MFASNLVFFYYYFEPRSNLFDSSSISSYNIHTSQTHISSKCKAISVSVNTNSEIGVTGIDVSEYTGKVRTMSV